MSKDTTGPAFPCDRLILDGQAYSGAGLTRREWFAGLAMQGQINNPLRLGDDEAHRLIAERSYRIADAMIAEGKK